MFKSCSQGAFSRGNMFTKGMLELQGVRLVVSGLGHYYYYHHHHFGVVFYLYLIGSHPH